MIGMSSQKQAAVVALRLRSDQAEKIIKSRARDSAKVILGRHAKEQAAARDITKDEIYRILRSGFVKGEPTLTNQGEWKCKITHRVRGARDAGVVTVILFDGRLFIKTVEWEDLR